MEQLKVQPVRKNIEIAIKGKWLTVPAVEINGKNIIVRGKWLKIAGVEAEQWLETELVEPHACLEFLKHSGFRADVLSFAQKLPDTEVKYSYPMEWDSIAAIPITSFPQWWKDLPQETRKNVRRAESGESRFR